MTKSIPEDQPRLVINYEYITPGADTICGEEVLPMPALSRDVRAVGAACFRLHTAFKLIEPVMRMPSSVHDPIDHEWTPAQGRLLIACREAGAPLADQQLLVDGLKEGMEVAAGLERFRAQQKAAKASKKEPAKRKR